MLRFLRDLGIAILAMVVWALALEGAMRIGRMRFEASFYTSTPDLGYALRPGSHGWNVEERSVYLNINSDGMRDYEHPVNTDPSTIRIAFLGDSQTMAKQTPLDETYFSTAAKILSGRQAKRVEALNFGVEGYSPSQQLVTLRKKVWKFHPQIVVSTLSPSTAILNSTRKLYPGFTNGTPFFEIKKDGKFELDQMSYDVRPQYMPNRWKDRSSDWMNASFLLALGNGTRIAMRDRWLPMWRGMLHDLIGPAPAVASVTERPNQLPADYTLVWPYLGPANPDLAEGWRVLERTLETMRDESEEHHAEFWFVTLDMTTQVDPDTREREAFQRKLGLDSLFIAEQTFERFATEKKILHIVLGPPLARYTAETHQPIRGFPGQPLNFGHWNSLGNQVAGAMIADALLRDSAVFKR
jgi:hypothetical protein